MHPGPLFSVEVMLVCDITNLLSIIIKGHQSLLIKGESGYAGYSPSRVESSVQYRTAAILDRVSRDLRPWTSVIVTSSRPHCTTSRVFELWEFRGHQDGSGGIPGIVELLL